MEIPRPRENLVGARRLLTVGEQEADAAGRGEQFGRDEKQPRLREPDACADEKLRERRGHEHARDQREMRDAETAADLDQLAIHAADPAHERNVDREERPDRDERDLRRFADAEPEQNQRDPCERRYRADRL